LEQVIQWQTSDLTRLMGLNDRGRIAPGMRADLNLIDLDSLRLHPPELVSDVPGGGVRMVQKADGYEMTLVAGTCTQLRGESTGEHPGRLVRRGA